MDEINNKIEELRQEVEELKQQNMARAHSPLLINTDANKPVLDRNLDVFSKQMIKDTISERIMDIVWNDYFYYFEWFGSVSGSGTDSNGDTYTFPGVWSTGSTGTATFDISSTHLTLKTGTTAGSGVAVYKRPDIQNILSWRQEQRFRTAFQVTSNGSGQTAYLIRGYYGTDIFYGFKIDGAKLQGVTKNGGSEQTVDLVSSLSVDTTYEIEAVFYPGAFVRFSVKKEGTDDELIELGAISSELPDSSTNTDFFHYRIGNSDAVDYWMKISYIKYIQKGELI